MAFNADTYKNFLAKEDITTRRLVVFGENLLEASRLVQPEWAALIEGPLERTREEAGEVLTARGILKGKTASTDEFLYEVRITGRALYAALFAKLKTKTNPRLLAIFPQGLKDINNITKGGAHELMKRLARGAADSADLLDASLVEEVKAFPEAWVLLRRRQQVEQETMDQGRRDRGDARKELERALLKVLFLIGAEYPGDEAKCATLVDFSLLYAPGKSSKKKKKAAAATTV